MYKIPFQGKLLYEGCLLAAIAHGVTAGEYPELAYEHSWDESNYSLNYSSGCRATITFSSTYIIAVFQDLSACQNDRSAEVFFTGVNEELMAVAKREALQYVLDDVNGETKPLISAAFWGTWDSLSSNQAWDEIWNKGGSILEYQLMDKAIAMENWDAYYELHDGQAELILSLYERKSKRPEEVITLTHDEVQCLYGDIAVCKESLQELQILF